MTSKRFYIALIAFITVLLAIIAFILGFRYNSTSLAKELLTQEISLLEISTSEMQVKKDELNNQISDINTELSTEDTMNNYYMEYYQTREDLQTEIEDLKKQSQELDSKITEIKGQTDNLTTADETEGKSYSLKSTKTYSCPNDIPAGRYKAQGTGTIIVSSSGKTRINENLGVAFDNTYTFNLNENEKIKVSSDTKITEIKEK